VVLFTGFGEKMGKNFEIIFKEFHNSETFVMSRALLEDYKAKAAQEERDRIIKLLESEAKNRKQIAESIEMDEFMSESDSEYFETESKFAIELIALIKGENK
jgi:hypothetical protein